MICPEGACGEKNMITIQSERLTAEEYIDFLKSGILGAIRSEDIA